MATRSAADLVAKIALSCKNARCKVDIFRNTTVCYLWEVNVGSEEIQLALSLDCARDFGENCMSFFIRRSTVEINDDCREKIYEKIAKDCNMGSLGFRLENVGRHFRKFWKAIGSEDPSQAMINMKEKIDGKMGDICNVLNGCRNELMGK